MLVVGATVVVGRLENVISVVWAVVNVSFFKPPLVVVDNISSVVVEGDDLDVDSVVELMVVLDGVVVLGEGGVVVDGVTVGVEEVADSVVDEPVVVSDAVVVLGDGGVVVDGATVDGLVVGTDSDVVFVAVVVLGFTLVDFSSEIAKRLVKSMN